VVVIDPRYTNSHVNPAYYVLDGTIPPHFSTMLARGGQEDRFYPDDAKRYIYDGDRHDFELVVIPVAYNDHYAMAIYKKSDHTIIYTDSLGRPPWREVKNALFDLVHFLNNTSTYTPNPTIIIPEHINRQFSNYECGFYASLSCESYLLYGDTYMPNLDFDREFQRLTQMLLFLCNDRFALYSRRTYGDDDMSDESEL
jgi:Ulp1 family protease